jgi:predicted DNA-binding protein
MSATELVVPASHASRLFALAERLGRPAQELLGEALDHYLDEHGSEAAPETGFDEVVFGEGDDAQRFSAAEFRQFPLRRQVRLLMSKPVYFYRKGRQIPREQAMSLRGIAKA